MCAVIILLIIIGLHEVNSLRNNTIVIGGYMLTLPGIEKSSDYIQIFNMWLEETNQTVNINGINYNFEVDYVVDSEDNLTRSVTKMIETYNLWASGDSDIDFYFTGATPSNIASEIYLNAILPYDKFILTTATGESNNPNYKTLSAYRTNGQGLDTIIPMARLAGVKTMIFLIESTVYPNVQSVGLLNSGLIELNGISVVKIFYLPKNTHSESTFIYYEPNSEDMLNISTTLDNAIYLDADLWFVDCFAGQSYWIAEMLRNKNYNPRMIVHFSTSILKALYDPVYTNISFVNRAAYLTDYWASICSWTEDINWNRVDDDDLTSDEFRNYYKLIFNKTADQTPWGWIGPWLLVRAVQKAKTLVPDIVFNTMLSSKFKSIMGEMSWSITHENQNNFPMCQISMNTKITESEISSINIQPFTFKVVEPALIATAELIYPIPTWEERIFDKKFGNDIIEWIVLGVSILLIVTSLCFLFWIIYQWKMDCKQVIAADPSFILVLLIGSILLYISPNLWTINNVNDIMCTIHHWTIGIGFVLIFGALFVKAVRLVIFHHYGKSLRKIRLNPIYLFTALSILVGIELFILAMMTGIDLPKGTLVIVDEHRISNNYYICKGEIGYTVMYSINLFYCGSLLLVGTIAAWRLRNFVLVLYNESKVLSFTIYNASVISILLTILQLTDTVDPIALFAVRSFGILIGTFVIVILTIGNIYHNIYKNISPLSTETSSINSTTQSIQSTQSSQ